MQETKRKNKTGTIWDVRLCENKKLKSQKIPQTI